MNPTNQTSAADLFMMPQRPSGLLSVLTILTIIGSVFTLVSSVISFFTAEKNYYDLKKVIESGEIENAPAIVKLFVNPDTLELNRIMMEYKWPLCILGLLGAVLCLIGAIQMRKLKKQGYFLWLAGVIIPIIGTIVLLENIALAGIHIFGYIITLAFIIMYSICKKELVAG